MDAKTKTKLVNTLMTRFIKLYEDKYGDKPKFNRNTERWGFGYMVDDLKHEAIDTLDYYFTLSKRIHTSQELLKNYDQFNEWRLEDIEDEENRARLRVETKQRVEEYREQWHQKPST